ncbi:MAG: cation-translocating P-type ATPase [Candidatus Moranbacteria bacterium]|nr:cation-translocating P-type ATPase [Candidatus Moranbacteria bacterium]
MKPDMSFRNIPADMVDKALLGILALALACHYLGFLPTSIEALLFGILSAIATVPVAVSAIAALRQRRITVDLLASIALSVSIANREWTSASFIGLMLASARVFDRYTENRARNAIRSLMKLRPENVRVRRDGAVSAVPLSALVEGDLVVIGAGERIPVDGRVVEGEGAVDQSSLTGESLPVDRKVGDRTLSSTLLVSGALCVRAEKVGADTAFEKMIRLVEESQDSKAGIQTSADRFAAWYITLSLLVMVALYAFTRDRQLVLSVLLVTCADDIAVALPMAFLVAIGNAAKRGIIVKGGAFLEQLTRVRTLVVDKTGTLTRGRLRVVRAVPFSEGMTSERLLSIAASASFFSDHPVSKAVMRAVEEGAIPFGQASEFEEHSGKGTHAVLDGKRIVCGKLPFLEEEGTPVSSDERRRISGIADDEAGSILPVAYDGRVAGTILLEDEVRPEAESAIARLAELGVREVVMLTGDNEAVARKVAERLGITTYHANLLPEDKIAHLKGYIARDDGAVAMVGDGVNDAAALTLSDVGIAMGVIGTDAAIEAADVALMKDDFSKIPEAIEIGRSVGTIAKQDFVIWGVVNVVGLILVFGRILGPEGAAVYNFLTDFLPLLNSMRLVGERFGRRP